MSSEPSTESTSDKSVRPSQKAPATEAQKRWLSWQFVSTKIHYNQFGVKHSYAGTVPEQEVARRRKKNKVAKASRKANR